MIQGNQIKVSRQALQPANQFPGIVNTVVYAIDHGVLKRYPPVGGLVRKLEPFEMLDQVLFTQVDSGLPISHIVLMGIGEPLDNFDNVMRFLELVNSTDGMNISMRHISLSTCGLVPMIDRLAEKKLQLTLSVSLHAPNDAVRNTIMPVNKA